MTNYLRQFAGKLEITRRQFTSLMLTFALGLGLAAAPDSFAQERWISTWTASPSVSSTAVAFENQTVREYVHTSIDGNRVRVRFTNALGTETLWINAAHVALRGLGSGIVPGTDRELT